MLIEFGSWLPDLPPNENKGATVAMNVIPFANTYKSFPSLSVYSTNGLDSMALGAISAKDDAGNAYNFAGDAGKLYLLASAAWTDISLLGGYTTPTTEKWNFEQFQDLIFATNNSDDIQYYQLGVSTNFANAGTNTPLARFLFTVREFLVAGYADNVPFRLQWSPIGNPLGDWAPSPTTQADIEDLTSADGNIMGGVGGEYGTVFTERGIIRMNYVGSPLIFTFDKIEGASGTPASRSICKIGIGNDIFYLGQKGFNIFDGAASVAIGENQVDKTFYSDVNQSFFENVISIPDPQNPLVFVFYPSNASPSGLIDKVLIYNYSASATKRWATASISLEFPFVSLSEGFTMETLDTINTNLDAIEPSLDSRIWTGGSIYFSAFNSDHVMANFTGAALDAVLETGEVQLNQGMRTKLKSVTPKVEGYDTITMQIGTRNDMKSSVSWGGILTPNNAGDYPCRADARYHRVRCNITGGFDFAQGIEDASSVPSGQR